MKTRILMPLLAVLVCACGSGSKEIELKEKTVVTAEPTDGLYDAYSRGAELVSLVPETVELKWNDAVGFDGSQQLTLTAKVRLDKEPDADTYNVAEYGGLCAYSIIFADINGQYLGDDGAPEAQGFMLPYLNPGLALTDRATEEAKFKELLQSKPGTVAEITFTGTIKDDNIDAFTDHAVSACLRSMFPLYEK